MVILIKNNHIVAGHDIGSGGLITTLMEMCFSSNNISANIDLSVLNEKDTVKVLFSENSGIIIQVDNEEVEKTFSKNGINALKIGEVISGNTLNIKNFENKYSFD